jgi:6,7-dimethyl-8-ribityllumazine synthase
MLTVKIHEGAMNTGGRRFAVVASRFNEFIVDKLLAGALDAFRRCGATEEDVEVFRCPGAFEIPAVARRALATGRFDGVVCLGTVIRGATPHFDLVVNHAAAGVAAIANEGKVAVAMGILACDTIEQAMERAGSKAGNRGYDAALVAIELADLFASVDAGAELNGRPAVKAKTTSAARPARTLKAEGGGRRSER